VTAIGLPRTPAERNLGFRWVLAVVFGWAIGFFACEWLEEFLSTAFVDGLVIGTAMGIAQGVVLRKRIAPFVPWVVLSVVGFAIGKLVSDLLGQALSGPLGIVLGGAVIGLSAGVAQWLLLRRRFPQATWWIGANVLGWAAGWSLISSADGSDLSVAMTYAVGAAGAALVGIITAIALIGLVRQPMAQPET
jgi:hypothetical protein